MAIFISFTFGSTGLPWLSTAKLRQAKSQLLKPFDLLATTLCPTNPLKVDVQHVLRKMHDTHLVSYCSDRTKRTC